MVKDLSSIIILTHNQLTYTKLCIESIRQYTDVPYEIIVVDNASTDGTVEWLKKQKDILLIENDRNMGFAAGCNQGIKASKGEYIVLLNNDTIVTKNWLKNMIDFLNLHDDAGIVGPVTNNISGQQRINVELKTIDDIHKFANSYNITPPKYRKVLRLVGFCMVMKKQLIDEIGLFDENFGIGNYEDDDLCLRTILSGKKLYMLESTFIYHFGSVTFKNSNFDYGKIMIQNRNYFVNKWGFDVFYYVNYNPYILLKFPITAKRVLDVGCAMGALGLELKNRYNVEVHGIEINKHVAEIAGNVLDKVYSSAVEDVIIKLPEDYYDVVIFGDVLEHLHNPWEVIDKIKKVLKKDGQIIASIPNINHVSILKRLLIGNWEYEDSGLLDKTHLRFFSYSTIENLFKSAGFDIIDVTRLEGNIDSSREMTLLNYLDNIAKILGYSRNYKIEGNTYQYVVVASQKKKATLSLCLITKDEERNIARCINSVKDIVDEIVVVDTGSKDKTVEIAKSFGAKVIHAKWEEDFSKARNIAIENATCDWILFLDADEEIKREDVDKIRPLLNDETVEAYLFKFVNYAGANLGSGLTEVHYNYRLFRNNGKLRYIYPVHENLRNVEENRPPIAKNAEVTILHYGYLSEIRVEKNKTERYIKLISKYLEDHPDDKFQHGNLAVEYYNLGNYNKALKHLLIATKGMDVNSYSATRMIRYLIGTYAALKDYDTALKIINDAKAYYIDVPDFKFLEGMVYVDQKRYEKAIDMFKECLLMGEYKGMFITMGGTGSYRARYMVAFCNERLNRLNDAVREYIEVLKENPNYQEVFIRLFDLFVKNEKPEDVYKFFIKYVDTKSPINHVILSKLYINAGIFEFSKQYLDNINLDIEGLNTLRGIVCMGLKDYKNAVKHFDMEYGKARQEANYYKVLYYIILNDIDKVKEILWEISDSSDKKLYMTIIGEIKAKFDEVRDSYFNLLDLLIKLQEFDLYNKVLGLYVNRFTREDYEKYAQLMIKYGLEDLAIEAYIKAADLNTQNPEVYRYLAERALGQGMYDEALSLAANAFNIDRMDIDNYALIYKIYKTIGNHEEAEEIDRMIKEIYPEISLKDRTGL
ncbi:glycosyltransferase [Thermoanaerobacter uzonensis]|uniref:glycosyltransferase n=1 Tax=Thermoanaerobacter uzonensis TaxID=447593 RepID=UPI003D766DD1